MELNLVQQIAIYAIPLIFAITLHEVAHGWVASLCGDQTARLSHRLSLNPIHHIDLVGTIVIPLLTLVTTGMVFGWAKPVPVDSRNMHHPRRDGAIVALAGPLANLIMAFGWGAIAALGLYLEGNQFIWLGIPLALMGVAGISINVWLAVLNMLPLPPLDGARILMSILPPRIAYRYSFIEPYSLIILIFLLMTNVLSRVLSPIFVFLATIVGKAFGL